MLLSVVLLPLLQVPTGSQTLTNQLTNAPPTHAPEQQSGEVQHVLEGAALGLIVGLIVGWYSHRLTCWRDDRNRLRAEKDRFGSFISKKIADIPERGAAEFFKSTKTEMRNAYAHFRHYCNLRDTERLDALWAEYETLEGNLNPNNEGAKAQMRQAGERFISMTPLPNNQQRIKSILANFQHLTA
jgi:hypothetical protein